MLETQALRRLNVGPINLSLQAGECVSLMGASGAGKSVLLRMIADLDPHEGAATLDGQPCSAMSAPAWRRMVTYVTAESGWWEPGVRAHFPRDTDFASLLPLLGIPADAAAWPVARLSTGERQRLALLRALRPATRILLLDEPTSGLDAESVHRVEALLHRELERRVAILLVTHDGAQAARMASRHLQLRGGHIEDIAA